MATTFSAKGTTKTSARTPIGTRTTTKISKTSETTTTTATTARTAAIRTKFNRLSIGHLRLNNSSNILVKEPAWGTKCETLRR